MPLRAAADRTAAPHRRLVVARALGPLEEELVRVSWLRTTLRLALDPEQHPWRRGWKLPKERKAPLFAVGVALILLAAFALGGCAQGPLQTVREEASTPAPAPGARCETLLVSREVQVPPEGAVGDLRLTLRDLPRSEGPLRMLVRKPRFAGTLEISGVDGAQPGRMFDVKAQDQLTLIFNRPQGASSDWPREQCKACRVDVEITGLFRARDALDAFFAKAMGEAQQIEADFAKQSPEPASHPSAELKQLADALQAEAARCSVQLPPALAKIQTALQQLDAARAAFYERGELPDGNAVLAAWESATESLQDLPAAADAAQAVGWPGTLRLPYAKRMHVAALHLELASQSFAPADKAAAAQWIGVALAEPAALEKRIEKLPPLKDLNDAAARLDWVDPRTEVLRLPGTAAKIRIHEFRAVRRGKRCIGPGGAAPVRDPESDARLVAEFLGGDVHGRLRVVKVADIAKVREAQEKSRALLCAPPQADVSDLFAGLDDKELGPIAERLEAVFAEAGEGDELAKSVQARAGELLCKLFEPASIERHVATVVGYKIFVEGGAHVLQLLRAPLVCNGVPTPAREVRQRLRDAYRAALDKHAAADKLCPLRSGKCPEEIAASVRRLFGLQKPQLAQPATGNALDYPPPFGFSDGWVHKLDRCAVEACAALAQLKTDAPAGQFDGAVCPVRAEGDTGPQEVTLDRPEATSSITLSSCDAHAGVRVTMHKRPEAGSLVAIASSHPFRYGSESVTKQGRNPQLGRIYERVADLSDAGDVSRRPDGAYEVALTPTVDNQVFFFLTLRRRDY